MKLQKAIRRLQRYVKYRKPDPDDHFHESVQLGIEALKFRKEIEDEDPDIKLQPLPGETEE